MLNSLPMKRLAFILLAMLPFALGMFGCEQSQPTPNPDQSEDVPAPIPQQLQDSLAVLDYWDDDKDQDRRLAAVAIGVAKNPGTVDAVNSHMIADRDPKVRATCAWAAGRIGDIRSMPILQKAASDSNENVRKEAILALGQFDDEDSIKQLTKIYKRGKDPDSLYALRALGVLRGDEIEGMPLPDNDSLLRKPPAPVGQIWYVDATSGKDENPGNSEKPFQSMQTGISRLRAGMGDTLYATSGKNRIAFREKVQITAAQSGAVDVSTKILAWPDMPAPMVYASRRLELPAGQDDRILLPFNESVLCVYRVSKLETRLLKPALKQNAIDAGEYFYDASKKVLSLKRPSNQNGATHLEVGVVEDGISIDRADYVSIQGFTVAYAQDTGIDFAVSQNGSVIGCTVHHCDRHGIFFFFSPYGAVTDCDVSACSYQGISLRSSPNTVVHKCSSHDNGVDGVLFLYDSDGGVVLSSHIERNQRGVGFIEGSNIGRIISTTFVDNKTDLGIDPTSDAVYYPEKTP